MTIVKNQSLAEEITQNTFYKALTARHGYEGKSREFTWLCSIAKNLAVDECRKNQKYACFDASAAETSDDIANHIADQDSALQIHLVLHELQEPYKEVFQMEAVTTENTPSPLPPAMDTIKVIRIGTSIRLFLPRNG